MSYNWCHTRIGIIGFQNRIEENAQCGSAEKSFPSFSFSLSGSLIVLHKPCAICRIFPNTECVVAEKIRFYLIGFQRVCPLQVKGFAHFLSGWRLKNYDSPTFITFICVTRDANEEKSGIGVNARPTLFPTKLNDRVATPFRPSCVIEIQDSIAHLIGLTSSCDGLIQLDRNLSISCFYLTFLIYFILSRYYRNVYRSILDSQWYFMQHIFH